MSSSSLKSLRDGIHREDAQIFDALSSAHRTVLEVCAGKTVGKISVNIADDATPRSRAAVAERQFISLHERLKKEVSNIGEVQRRFVHSVENIIKCDIEKVTSAEISRLGEADCRRALHLACRALCQTTKVATMQVATYPSLAERVECQCKQLLRWDAEACKHAEEVDRLLAEKDPVEKRMKHLTSSVITCAKRLATLASPSKKVKKEQHLNEADALNAAINNVEKTVKADQERIMELEKELADAAEQLVLMRAACDDASSKAQGLELKLEVALERGTTLAKQCDELDEKLRCSTCMDRQKNVTFACGHAYCNQCAAEWNTCTLNCKRPNSDKPVKFRYPLFL